METNAFASLAHLKIILIPVGPISRAAFDKWTTIIRTFESIPLVDVPPARYDDKTRFMPNTSSSGHLHLVYMSHPPPIWHHALALFRPSIFPVGVIGITSCSPSTSLSAAQTEFRHKVKNLYPYNSPYPLARSCYAFEEDGDGSLIDAGDSGIEVIPSVLGNKTSGHIAMLLAGFCSQILASFSTLSKALDTPRGWEILHSSLFPVYPAEPDDEQPPQLKVVVDSPRTSLESKRGSISNHSSPTGDGFATPRPTVLSRSSSSATTTSNRNSTILSNAKKRQSMLSGNSPPNARLSKLLGDLFLLAGRLTDALTCYNEALVQLKSSPDPVWHASILEGMSTVSVLDAWVDSSGLAASLSANTLRDPWAEISDRMGMAIYMYFKAPLPDGSNDYPSLVLLYTSSVLRYTHFLFSIWSSNGWGPMAFLTMLTPALPASFSQEPPTNARRWRMTTHTTITRTQIANVAAQAHGAWIMHLQPHDRIRLLSSLAGFYSCLGFRRKEVYVLRELVSVIMDLMVLGREEKREQHVARLGIRDSNLTEIAANAHVTVKEFQITDGNRSILRLVAYICAIYGVNLKTIPLARDAASEEAKDEEWEAEAESIDFAKRPTYGWSELQLGVVRESIAVAEALPELPSLAQFSLSSLRILYSHLNASEQYSLYTAAKNAIHTSQRRGEPVLLEYWSGRPVVSVEFVALQFSRIPVEHSKTELAPRDTVLNAVAAIRDPFIYNPRLRSSKISQNLLVQNEQVEVILTLQNPFLFDLELSNVSLSTSGVSFKSQPVSVIIPPNTFCPVRLSGVAEEPGTLTVRGCFAQAAGCDIREFLLPLSTEEEEEKIEKRRSMKEAELDRFKFTGLDARLAEREQKRLSITANAAATITTSKEPAPTRFIECKVVREQPLLRIRRTSLTHGAVMMYDGESSSIRLTVENVSSHEINYLKLTFDDSTIAPMRQALSDGNLSVAETYETEYSLLQRPVFQWKRKGEPREVKPGQKVVLTISCMGKVGCISGSVQLAYANTREEASPFFYTRQILYPVLVTVNHTLECHSMDILPFSPIVTSDGRNDADLDTYFGNSLLEVDADGAWCLFVVDVRNGYTLPFEVHFDRNQPGTKQVSCSRLVPPGCTSRITLPIRRLFLPASKVSEPIPTLTDRQFVVSKEKTTDSDQAMQKEMFWYREELFNSVTARWKEPGGARHGELSLRRQRLTSPMLTNLKTDPIHVTLHLVGDPAGQGETANVVPLVNGKASAKTTHFYSLRCTAFNATAKSEVLVLSLASNPSEHFHVEGNMSEISMGRVESKSSKTVDIPICFVAEGRFEFVAEIHSLGMQERIGEGELKVVARDSL